MRQGRTRIFNVILYHEYIFMSLFLFSRKYLCLLEVKKLWLRVGWQHEVLLSFFLFQAFSVIGFQCYRVRVLGLGINLTIGAIAIVASHAQSWQPDICYSLCFYHINNSNFQQYITVDTYLKYRIVIAQHDQLPWLAQSRVQLHFAGELIYC